MSSGGIYEGPGGQQLHGDGKPVGSPPMTAPKTMKTDTQMLVELAAQLEKWATESREGGWSTHQVDPMRRKVQEICDHLSPKLKKDWGFGNIWLLRPNQSPQRQDMDNSSLLSLSVYMPDCVGGKERIKEWYKTVQPGDYFVVDTGLVLACLPIDLGGRYLSMSGQTGKLW